jgi:hypothetical protein
MWLRVQSDVVYVGECVYVHAYVHTLSAYDFPN